MITTARQLKDLIRNLSKKKSADAQILMRNYMMERFLERIALSDYKDRFILKGGMLVAAMVGLDARATMDMDATIKGANVSVEDVENIISSILSVPLEDGVEFRVKRISEIMEEAEYPGVRVSLETTFDGVRTPLKIDISTGDVITPREVRYSFKLMLEERSIEVWAYNLETVLAEKLETVISRNVTNTRMRDFYDIHILQQIYGESLSAPVLLEAMSCGVVPVLAGDAPHWPLLQEGGGGLWCGAADLVPTLAGILAQPHQLAELSLAARRTVERHFRRQDVIPGQLALLHQARAAWLRKKQGGTTA